MVKEKLAPPKHKKGECQMLVWVPRELKTKFKAKCAEKRISMQKAIADLLTKFSK